MLRNGKLYGSIIPPDVSSLRLRDVTLGAHVWQIRPAAEWWMGRWRALWRIRVSFRPRGERLRDELPSIVVGARGPARPDEGMRAPYGRGK